MINEDYKWAGSSVSWKPHPNTEILVFCVCVCVCRFDTHRYFIVKLSMSYNLSFVLPYLPYLNFESLFEKKQLLILHRIYNNIRFIIYHFIPNKLVFNGVLWFEIKTCWVTFVNLKIMKICDHDSTSMFQVFKCRIYKNQLSIILQWFLQGYFVNILPTAIRRRYAWRSRHIPKMNAYADYSSVEGVEETTWGGICSVLNITRVLCMYVVFKHAYTFAHKPSSVCVAPMHVVGNTHLPVYAVRVSMAHQSLNTGPMSCMWIDHCSRLWQLGWRGGGSDYRCLPGQSAALYPSSCSQQ